MQMPHTKLTPTNAWFSHLCVFMKKYDGSFKNSLLIMAESLGSLFWCCQVTNLHSCGWKAGISREVFGLKDKHVLLVLGTAKQKIVSLHPPDTGKVP